MFPHLGFPQPDASICLENTYFSSVFFDLLSFTFLIQLAESVKS